MPIYSDISRRQGKTLELNEDAVFQAINNILSTRKGERLFLPEFGSNIKDLLFEPIDEETAFLIKSEILRAIEEWDLRVDIEYAKSEVIPYPDENKYEIKIVFSIIGLTSEKFEYVQELKK